MDDYFEQLFSLKDSFMLVNTQEDIDKLLQNGYVFKETTEQVCLANATIQNESRECLFGNGSPAKLPSIALQKSEKAAEAPVVAISPIPVTLNSEEQTIWFETKKLTGGSRNILDLSMRSLVERGDPTGTPFDLGEPGFMRGGVEFFGLNPTATDKPKDITLKFEGVDYEGNTILFPIGENANGTWRLQIKGVSSSDVKITDAFRAKGEKHYLVEKIITFTKIEDNYYSMSIFPESELEKFEAISRILARNGSTKNAKRLGLL